MAIASPAADHPLPVLPGPSGTPRRALRGAGRRPAGRAARGQRRAGRTRAQQVEYRRLGASGVRVPEIGLGSWLTYGGRGRGRPGQGMRGPAYGARGELLRAPPTCTGGARPRRSRVVWLLAQAHCSTRVAWPAGSATRAAHTAHPDEHVRARREYRFVVQRRIHTRPTKKATPVGINASSEMIITRSPGT